MHHAHDDAAVATLDGQARAWLRLEGLAALVAGVVIYTRLGADLIWLVPALLAVDISAVGYLRNPRVGALTYNLFHNWATGLVVLGAGLAANIPIVAIIGSVLIAHVGMDRAAGYGLKLDNGLWRHPPGAHRQAPDRHRREQCGLGRRRLSPANARTSNEAIVAAARTLLEAGGPDAVTMQAVADAVGVRAPSLYKRVTDRSALLTAVADAVAADLGAATAPPATIRDPRRTVRQMAKRYRAFAHGSPHAYQLLFGAGAQPSPGANAQAAAGVLRVASALVGPANFAPGRAPPGRVPPRVREHGVGRRLPTGRQRGCRLRLRTGHGYRRSDASGGLSGAARRGRPATARLPGRDHPSTQRGRASIFSMMAVSGATTPPLAAATVWAMSSTKAR